MAVLWAPDLDLNLSEQGKGREVTMIIQDTCFPKEVSDHFFIPEACALVTWTVNFEGLL